MQVEQKSGHQLVWSNYTNISRIPNKLARTHHISFAKTFLTKWTVEKPKLITVKGSKEERHGWAEYLKFILWYLTGRKKQNCILFDLQFIENLFTKLSYKLQLMKT